MSEKKSVLKLDCISKSFQSGLTQLKVLENLNFEIFSGKSVSIRGQSGSGKTTLLNCIAGIETPDSGSVYWGDRKLSELSEKEKLSLRGRRLGFIFQAFYLVPELDVLDNVILPARVLGGNLDQAKSRARDLLSQLRLDSRLHANVIELSGGERQRVAIARALINKPDVILADEPTGNLDEHTAEEVMEELLSVVKEEAASLVLVTHSRSYAQLLNRSLYLSEGILREVN